MKNLGSADIATAAVVVALVVDLCFLLRGGSPWPKAWAWEDDLEDDPSLLHLWRDEDRMVLLLSYRSSLYSVFVTVSCIVSFQLMYYDTMRKINEVFGSNFQESGIGCCKVSHRSTYLYHSLFLT